jgi:hypothetical protein
MKAYRTGTLVSSTEASIVYVSGAENVFESPGKAQFLLE